MAIPDMISILGGKTSWTVYSGGDGTGIIVQIDKRYISDLGLRGRFPLRLRVILPFTPQWTLNGTTVEAVDALIDSTLREWGVVVVIASSESFREYVLYTLTEMSERQAELEVFFRSRIPTMVQVLSEMNSDWSFYISCMYQVKD